MNVRFESVNRQFEPLDESLETSDVESSCPPGMVADKEICGKKSFESHTYVEIKHGVAFKISKVKYMTTRKMTNMLQEFDCSKMFENSLQVVFRNVFFTKTATLFTKTTTFHEKRSVSFWVITKYRSFVIERPKILSIDLYRNQCLFGY